MKFDALKKTASNSHENPDASRELPSTAPGTRAVGRRQFLRTLGVAGAAVASGSVVASAARAAVPRMGMGMGMGMNAGGPGLHHGDAAILRLLAAAEIIETDLWQQYNELGGVDAPDTGYTAALEILDEDQPQYISDNTDDEMSHAAFLNAYLKSKGAAGVDLSKFAQLPPSQVSTVPQTGRLTNLKQLTVDTSWWTRYRSTINPDLGATFANAVPSLNSGQHTAIPRNDGELDDPNNPSDHIKAIAFTAGFHFAFIEQGGTSLYAAMAQKVKNPEVLRIVLSIGGSEIMHFQTWQDKAGNATPLTDFDAVNNSSVTFEDLTTGQPETLQANLIMPEPCEFISSQLPPCAVIRPTTRGQISAMAAINGFINDGLFIGQPKEFTDLLLKLAAEADKAHR
jgi:hypothetical protein